MMRFLGQMLCCLFFGMACVSANTGPPATGEARPESGIYDPLGAISPPGRSAIIREATSIRESSGLDMLVVVVERLNGWEPQPLADDLANRWGYHGGRALILWIPDKGKENPWISVSGMVRSEISTAKLEMIVERAKARARADVRTEESLRRTMVSLGEDLRFAAGGAVRKVEQNAKMPRLRTIDAFLILIRDSKKIVIGGVIGIGGLLVVIYIAMNFLRKMRMALIPRKFPEVSWKRRFGAPYGGIVYTASPKKRHHPHETR